MRVDHCRVKDPLSHVTIIPFQTYDESLHDKNSLRAHEGLWIKRFGVLEPTGLNRRLEVGHCNCMDFEIELCEKAKKPDLYRNKLRKP